MKKPAEKPEVAGSGGGAARRWPRRLAVAVYALYVAYLLVLALCHRFG